MAKHFTIDEGLDLEDGKLAELAALLSLPGERVKPNRATRFVGEDEAAAAARNARFGDGTLTVAEIRLEKAANGSFRPLYGFEDVEGFHHTSGFSNEEGFESHYGILIHRDGETWFVRLDGRAEEPSTVGEPLRVSDEMSRCGRYFFGLPDDVLAEYGHEGVEGRTAPSFLASHDGEPRTGEYSLSPLADGTWRLDASPWSSAATRDEVSLAENAVSSAKASFRA